MKFENFRMATRHLRRVMESERKEESVAWLCLPPAIRSGLTNSAALREMLGVHSVTTPYLPRPRHIDSSTELRTGLPLKEPLSLPAAALDQLVRLLIPATGVPTAAQSTREEVVKFFHLYSQPALAVTGAQAGVVSFV
jgi:hypothetical protein